jgi:hypothetical protein|tara:strand:- start:1587 stop:2039 length:453 start_codon:yes stop_codon:yes gene_type:complete
MMTKYKYILFLLFDLPSAFFCGVRLTHLDNNNCKVIIKHSWFNKNPFKSIFWAAQGMAAELSTGALLKDKIKHSKLNVSMLVVENNSSFYKKATGKISFSCSQGSEIDNIINLLTSADTPQTITLKSIGVDNSNDKVSEFCFKWSLKVRN